MKRLTRLVRDENLDLYLLGLVALAFTALGVVGLAETPVLLSATLALLALLAFSQIKSRRQVADLVADRRLLRDDFPPELAARRARARDYLFIGRSMARTANTMRADLKAMLESGARIRVMMVDPDNEPVIAAAALIGYSGSDPALLAGRIRGVLAELDHLRSLTGGNLEIRLTRFVPTVGLQVIDGVYVCAQRFEHRPPGESGPILALEPGDGLWFHRFAAEAERMWDDGVPWPG
ncbi:hypothetical protein GT755_06135 [Herbidospora sp. NEAU-GS84]|uniref:Uncharacterized protein n=1 Tax=Herbidospora solisilvae TaxID=2696284 RepID=A0A7C9J1A4_9ACTN|nr:hypothetical protein [Herbidospora solisilvae]NAS21265.1 hypothetical protein [Herbidospora solisilvae]